MTDTICTSNPQDNSTMKASREGGNEGLSMPSPNNQGPFVEIQDDHYTLNDAAKNGDLVGVKRLMEKEDSIPWGYECALVQAAKEGHDEIVRYMVECKVKSLSEGINSKDIPLAKVLRKKWDCYTYEEALKEAVISGHTKVVTYLLQQGISKFSKVLGWATERGNLEMVRRLVERIGDLTRIKKGALDEAAYKAVLLGNLDILKYLVDQGANVNALYTDAYQSQRRILSAASETGNLEAVKYLVEGGADLHAGDEAAFYIAVLKGHLTIVKYLVEQGADIHCRKERALYMAAFEGYPDIVRYLVEQGADPHAYEECALMAASRIGNLEIVKYLVEQGADIYAQGEKALKDACTYGHLAVVKYLVKQETNGCPCKNLDLLK